MAIFIPKWERWKNKQPSGPVDVNWNNDLTNNLVFAQNGDKINLVSDGIITVTGNVPVVDNALSFNNSLSNYIDYSTLPIKNSGQGYSVASIFALNATSSANESILDNDDSGSSATRIFQFRKNTSNKFEAIAFNSSGVAFSQSSLASLVVKKSATLLAVVTLSNLRVYLDNIPRDIAITGTLNQLSARLRIGARYNTLFQPCNGLIFSSFVWGTPLSYEKSASFYEYPYQLLKPRSQFFFLGAGAANETVDIALTTVNPTIAIGASQLQHADVAITTTNPTIAAELSQALHADVAITTVNPTIAATVNETVVLASVALTTQNPIIAARITGGEPDFVLGGVHLHGEVKRGKRRLDTDEEYEAEYNENVPVDNPLIKLDGSVTKIKESMDQVKKQADKKYEDDIKAIVKFVKEYRSNIISTWLN